MVIDRLIISRSIVKGLEIGRTLLAGLGFFLAYHYYAKNLPQISLYALIIFVVVPLTGLTGLESIFFGKASAEAKGCIPGGSYQIQSGLNNLAIAITALIVWFSRWPIKAELAVLFVTLIFFSLSAINHAVEFFIHENRKIIHLLRLILTLLLVVASLPIVASVLSNT